MDMVFTSFRILIINYSINKYSFSTFFLPFYLSLFNIPPLLFLFSSFITSFFVCFMSYFFGYL